MGPWCLQQGNRPQRESLNYTVMSCPWDSVERVETAVKYLGECHERILLQLTEYLNTIHQEPHGLRFWRIILGTWLYHYMHSLYDRYIHLDEAFNRYPEMETKVMDPVSFLLPNDTVEFMDLIRGDQYNLQLYSQLLVGMGHRFAASEFNWSWAQSDEAHNRGKSGWKAVLTGSGRLARQIADAGFTKAAKRFARVALYDMYMPRTSTWTLAARSGMRIMPVELRNRRPFALPPPNLGHTDRTGLVSIKTTNEFENLFVQTLPANVPTLYLEGFRPSMDDAHKQLPKKPQTIMSATGWSYNDRFKFMAAAASERGSRLIASQHGGGYGVYKFNAAEDHEARVSDAYMVWGWADTPNSPCQNLPSQKLSQLAKNPAKQGKPRRKSSTLFVATSNSGSGYLYRMHSSPLAGQWADYYEWQYRFFDAAFEKLGSSLFYRPDPGSGNLAIPDSVSERYPWLGLDEEPLFYRRALRSRLVIIDHPSTTFLEALTGNIPTVLFWNRRHWQMRQEAEPYFEDLREAGVLLDSPESAAATAESVVDDPWAWWSTGPIQDSRAKFVERFCLTSTDCAGRWSQVLGELNTNIVGTSVNLRS